MQTSGNGNRDLRMLAVPLAILTVFGIYTGGGVEGTLRTIERTLWSAVDWVGRLIS